MKGGEAIASGYQGCIFNPKLVKHDRLARTSDDPANRTIASKVFDSQNTFAQEIATSAMLRDVSNEGLVTIIDDENASFAALNGLNASERASAKKQPGPGCSGITIPLSPVYVMQMPLIDGDLKALGENTRPISFLTKAYNALMRLQLHKIVHGDMAERNIFYKGDDALIGDFGFAINFSNYDPVTNGLNKFYEQFIRPLPAETDEQIYHSLLGCFMYMDQVTIEASVAYYIYKEWDRRDAIVNVYNGTRKTKFADDLKNGKYDTDVNGVWLAARTDRVIRPQGVLYMNQYRCLGNLPRVMYHATILRKEAYWVNVVKDMLLKSDVKRFMQCAIKYINISKKDKEQLLKQIICFDNFIFFYRYAGIEVPADIWPVLVNNHIRQFTETELSKYYEFKEQGKSNNEILASIRPCIADMELPNLLESANDFRRSDMLSKKQLNLLIKSKQGGRRRTNRLSKRNKKTQCNRKH